MSDVKHVVVNFKDLINYYLIQPRRQKISPKLNIHEQGFRKGKIRDKKFYNFQINKCCILQRGGGGARLPVLKVRGEEVVSSCKISSLIHIKKVYHYYI